MTNEERNLLEKMASGALDGFVGDELTTSGGSTFWKVINEWRQSSELCYIGWY